MRILSVNVGDIREVLIKQQIVRTSIYKTPAIGRIPVHRLGLVGDARVEPRKMGPEHHAVYAYPFEHYGHWERELGREPFPMGQFGENLTVTGLKEDEVRIGDVFRVGTTVLQVSQPRIPCSKLNERMGTRFASMFLASCKVGYYLRVLQEGTVGRHDTFELLDSIPNSPTIEEFVRVSQHEYWDARGLRKLLQAETLIPAWREIVLTKLARAEAAYGWHGLREFEVTHRVEACPNTLSLHLKCARGRALAQFKAGQQLTVVLGRHTTDQTRKALAISSSPRDLSSYRITVRRPGGAGEAQFEDAVASHLGTIKVQERVFCGAPQGLMIQDPERSDRINVLLSQGLGIAPILSFLHQFEAHQESPVSLFHERSDADSPLLLGEARALIERSRVLHMNFTEPDRLSAGLIREHVPLERAHFFIAGSRSFIDRIVGELRAAGIALSALKTQNSE